MPPRLIWGRPVKLLLAIFNQNKHFIISEIIRKIFQSCSKLSQLLLLGHWIPNYVSCRGGSGSPLGEILIMLYRSRRVWINCSWKQMKTKLSKKKQTLKRYWNRQSNYRQKKRSRRLKVGPLIDLEQPQKVPVKMTQVKWMGKINCKKNNSSSNTPIFSKSRNRKSIKGRSCASSCTRSWCRPQSRTRTTLSPSSGTVNVSQASTYTQLRRPFKHPTSTDSSWCARVKWSSQSTPGCRQLRLESGRPTK